MKFLQEVATDFGGNPNLITIYGESAGSGSVSNHLVNPRSWGLFHRAIAQSGAMASEWVAQPFNVSTIKTDQLLRNARCDGKVTYAEELACLRSLTAIDFYYSSMNLPSGLLQWSPVIDGVELPAHPRQLMKQGKIAPNVPVILGSTRDEGTILLGVPYGVEPSDYYSTLEEYIGADLAPAVAAKYQLSDFPSTWWTLVSRYYFDSWFLVPLACTPHCCVPTVVTNYMVLLVLSLCCFFILTHFLFFCRSTCLEMQYSFALLANQLFAYPVVPLQPTLPQRISTILVVIGISSNFTIRSARSHWASSTDLSF